MVDPIAISSVAAVNELHKTAGGLLTRWLGPVMDEAGADLALRYRQRNVQRAVERGEKKSDLNVGGVVPLRVAAEVFEKAQWTDDEFVAEYLSGVLASSRNSQGNSDAAVPWAAFIGRMSSDQLRLHYVLYAGVRAYIVAEALTGVWSWTGRHFFIDIQGVFSSLGWELEPESDIFRFYEAAYALQREDCLTDITHGNGDYLRDEVSYTRGHEFTEQTHYFVFRATATGIKFFLNGHGYGDHWFSAFEDPALEFDDRFDSGDALPAPVKFVQDLPRVRPVVDPPEATDTL